MSQDVSWYARDDHENGRKCWPYDLAMYVVSCCQDRLIPAILRSCVLVGSIIYQNTVCDRFQAEAGGEPLATNLYSNRLSMSRDHRVGQDLS